MTTVTFSTNDKYVRISAIDHAYGSDMVCNAVSAMMYSLEAWLMNHPEFVKGHISAFVSGRAEIEFIPLKTDVYKILEFVYSGLRQVEHTYGEKFISVKASATLLELWGELYFRN